MVEEQKRDNKNMTNTLIEQQKAEKGPTNAFIGLNTELDQGRIAQKAEKGPTNKFDTLNGANLSPKNIKDSDA